MANYRERCRTTVPLGAEEGYQRPWGACWDAPVSSRPNRAGGGGVSTRPRGADDRDPDRIILRTMWHALHVRDHRGQAWTARCHRDVRPRLAALRQRLRRIARGSIRGGPLRAGAALDIPRPRRLPSDVQL